jgi:tetratricopeptide (TPR) repeat protein
MQRGLTHALGLESGLMAPVTLAAIAADTDAALRGSSTLASTGSAARPVAAASRWKFWLPLLIAAALAAGLAAWTARQWWSAPAAPAAVSPVSSLVVEPFEVVSSGDRALAEGIGEVVMERLRLLPGVRIVSFTPDPTPAASSADAVLTRHQVDGLVRGTATWNDGLARVRVTVLRAGVGTPVFERAFEQPVERAAELPRLVANDMVRWLGVHASSDESSRLSRADDAAPAAFEAYLRGRAAMRHLSEVNVARAIEHFNQALAMNRNHGPSLVGLAECYLLQGVTYGSLARGKATLLARDAIERALALDGDHAAAINADAQLRFYLEWDGDGAEKAFQRALELNPNADSVRQHYAMFLVARDRLDAALSQVQSAVYIDPASLAARAALGMVWYYTGNQKQAERTFLEVLSIDGRYSQARKGLVRVLLAGKQYAKVLGLLDGWAQGSTDPQDRFFLAARGIALAGTGQVQQAHEIADELISGANADGEVDAASVLVALGEGSQALTLLQQAVQQRSARTLFLRHDARFDGLRSNAGFTQLLDSMDFKR